MRKVFVTFGIFWSIFATVAAQKKVVCYWDSRSIGNEDLKGHFEVKDIDPTICTHIIYAYIRFTTNVNLFSDYEDAIVREFINLKSINPDVKLLVGVGGPRQGTQIPSKIAATATDRDTLATKIRNFMEEYNFDGCDFDWQWPGQGTGSSPDDKENYIKLLSDLSTKFTRSKIFSISVAARPEDIDKSYDIQRIISYVDFINLNTYNFHGLQGENFTAFHSPYRKDPSDETNEAEWNAVSVIENWLSKEVPAEMLTLGIPTYGRSFTLADINQINVGAPITGVGTKSEYLADNTNFIPYVEICYNLLFNAKWFPLFNDVQYAPYVVYNANQWAGYDDLSVVSAKIHLALRKELGGINYATIDRDDFYGQCGGPKFPLIRLGYDAIINGVNVLNKTVISDFEFSSMIIPEDPIKPEDPTTTTIPTTTTTIPTTTTTIPTTTTTTPTTTTTTPTTTTTTTKTTTTTPTTTTSTTTTPTTSSSTDLTTTTTTKSATTPSSTVTTTTSKDPDLDKTSPSTTTTRAKPTTTKSITTRITTTTFKIPTPPYTVHIDSTSVPDDGGFSTTIKSSTTIKTTTTTRSNSSPTTTFPRPPVTPDYGISTNVDQSNEGTESDFVAVPTTEARTTTSAIPKPPVTPGQTNRAKRSVEEDPMTYITCPEGNGKFQNPYDYRSYIICADYVPHLFYCNNDSYFNEINEECGDD